MPTIQKYRVIQSTVLLLLYYSSHVSCDSRHESSRPRHIHRFGYCCKRHLHELSGALQHLLNLCTLTTPTEGINRGFVHSSSGYNMLYNVLLSRCIINGIISLIRYGVTPSCHAGFLGGLAA